MTDEELQELRDWFGQNNEQWCGDERNALVIVALGELARHRREVCLRCRHFRPKGGAHCAIATWAIGAFDDDSFSDEVDEKHTCWRWEPKS